MQAPCCPTTHDIIQWISPTIALLAVVFGPIITWKFTGRQIEEARVAAEQKSQLDRKIANKQIVAPMRQAWIEKLRKDIASLLTLCNRYALRGTAEQTDSYDDIRELILVIRLSLNPSEDDHSLMITLLEDFFIFVADDRTEISDSSWHEQREQETRIVELANEIFRREWKRVKSDDAN